MYFRALLSVSLLPMKDEIKKLAVRLFTLNGYRGVSFGDLNTELGTTRANIHYHYGSKSGLAEEVLASTADEVMARYRKIWANADVSLKTKLKQSYTFNAGRYSEYNVEGEGRIWSLIARFRIDRDVITPMMIAKLNEVTRVNEESVATGVKLAVDNGELVPDAPVEEIACLISGIIHFAPLISQAPHDIGRLKQTYDSLTRMIEKAYSAGAEGEAPNKAKRKAATGSR